MTAHPPVSIGLPVRNGAVYLEEAVSDLLGQTAGDFELLISDNASDDQTEEICREAAADERVRYIRQPQNIGAAANYNEVFHRTSAPFFRWASHDDRCAPTHLEACLEMFKSTDPTTVLVYPQTLLIDADGDEIRIHDDQFDLQQPTARGRLVQLARIWGLCNPIMGLMRRDAAQRTRLIDTFRGSDLVMIAELAMLGPIREVREPLFLRRIHPGSALQGGTTDVPTWLDPRAKRESHLAERTSLPVLREILRSVQRGQGPAADRARTEVAVSTAWLARRARINGGRLKIWIRALGQSSHD